MSPTQTSAEGSPQNKQSKRPPQISQASLQAQLNMLRAKQKALRQKAMQLRQQLQKIQQMAPNNTSTANAEKHLSKAISDMQNVERSCAQLPYQSKSQQQTASKEMLEKIIAIKQQLDQSVRTLDSSGTKGNSQGSQQQQARKMAMEMYKLSKMLKNEKSPPKRRELLNSLKQAEELLKSLNPPKKVTMRPKNGNSNASSALVLTEKSSGITDPAQKALELSRRFWSLSIQSSTQNTQKAGTEPSDVEFSPLEKIFFQRAAEYLQGSNKK